MAEAPHLSLVLACYNEAEHLEASFAEIKDTLEQAPFSFEILFVDDVSRDRTREILAAIVAAHPDLQLRTILHEKNRGSRRAAWRTASARRAARSRATSTSTSRCTAATSRRWCGRSTTGADVATLRRIYAFQVRSLDRYFMSRGYSFLVRQLLGVRFADTETGYKFFRRDKVLPLLDEIEDPGWFWDTEFMVRAARRGLRMVEIPGAYIRRKDKTSTVSGVRDSLRYFEQLVRFRSELRREGGGEGARRDRLGQGRTLRLLHGGHGPLPAAARAAAARLPGCACSARGSGAGRSSTTCASSTSTVAASPASRSPRSASWATSACSTWPRASGSSARSRSPSACSCSRT